MGLDEQLRQQLTRSADAFQPDTIARLPQVMRTARYRRRRQRAFTTVLAVAVIAAIAVVLPRIDLNELRGLPANTQHNHAPHHPTSSVREHHAQLHIPLTGDWESDPVPSRQVRAAINAEGLGPSAATQLLDHASMWQTRMTFGEGGGYGYVVQVVAWDPSGGATQPATGDRYSYRTVASHKLVLSKIPTAPPGYASRQAHTARLIFTYRIHDQRLYLAFRGASRDLSDAATAKLIAWTAAPLRRMTY